MEDMIKIVKQSSEKMAIKLSDNIIKSVAERSVFTPRIANNLLKRILDYKTSRDIKSIADKDIKKIFDMLGIDNIGLDEVARKVLTALANSSRGTCGVNSLASIVNVEQSTLKNIIEPQLLMHELIVYQSRGRAITSAGLKHLGREDIINKTKEAR
jgi:Holliday junction DNA helicase RuvB